MKKSLLLIVVLAALVGLAVVTKKQKEARLSEIARRGVQSRELLLPNLDVNAVKAVLIKTKDQETNLRQTDKGWVVGERDGYAADFDKLGTALLELRETKTGEKSLIGRGAWAEAEVIEPTETVKEGTGTLVKLSDDKGGEIASLILGSNVTVSGSNSTEFGQTPPRLVRVPQDEDTLWQISGGLSSFVARPEDWLDKSFLSLQDIQTVSVTPAKKEDAWKVSRPSKDIPDYALENPKAGEELDATKLALASLLSAASFNDVKTQAQAGDLFKDASKVQITTFEGFTYDLQVAKTNQDGADKFFMTVAVKANLPKERQAGKDEKEEDKKRLDDEFKAQQDRLKEKLEKEQKLSGWVYEVAEYTINNLLKPRSEILKAPEAAPAPEASGAATPTPAPTPAPIPMPAPAAPAAPVIESPAPAEAPAKAKEATQAPAADKPQADPLKPATSVTTPPVSIPPAAEAGTIKPAPKADANPADPQ